jgi:hypothetical protein
MKISQTIDAGRVTSIYMPSWSSINEVDLNFGDNKVTCSLPEDIMERLHSQLGEKLTSIAEKRLEEAKELVAEPSEEEVNE